MTLSNASRGPRKAFTLIEILFATAILAFAMIPVFGIMTSGMIRTDTNVGYSNAIEVATAVMNTLQSEQTDFQIIPPSTTIPVVYPPRGDIGPDGGNVVGDAALDSVFPAGDGWTTTPEGNRTVSRNGINYHVQLWVGRYAAANDLQFGYFEDPLIDWSAVGGDFANNGNRFHQVNDINAAEYTAGYSPYLDELAPGSAQQSRIMSHPWATDETVFDQQDLTDPTGAAGYLNFAKLVVRVSWGYERRNGRGRAKDFYLVSFKADLAR